MCILFSPNIYFLNIVKTNYKVVTGPVTSGSRFLLVQKHFALVQDYWTTAKVEHCIMLLHQVQQKQENYLVYTQRECIANTLDQGMLPGQITRYAQFEKFADMFPQRILLCHCCSFM